MWKVISNEEMEIFKERSDLLKKENKRDWEKKFEEREQVSHIYFFAYNLKIRRNWCDKLGISNLASWEEIDMINR